MEMAAVACELCEKKFDRPKRRYNEAIKMNWRQFCSNECQGLFKQSRVVDFCKTCGAKVVRQRSQIEPSGNAFCSHTCSAKYTNHNRTTQLMVAKRNRNNAKPICANLACNQQIGIDNQKFCSPQCRYAANKVQNEKYVLNEIVDFVKKQRRMPIKHELPSLASRGRRAFGSWNKAVEAAGFKSNPVLFSKKFVANDSHPCDSLSEKIIDDWLFARQIPHEVKVKYPWDNGMSVDFKVGEYWIELFGLAGQLRSYDRLMKTKLRKIKEYRLSLISIYLSDLFPKNRLEEKLGVLLI